MVHAGSEYSGKCTTSWRYPVMSRVLDSSSSRLSTSAFGMVSKLHNSREIGRGSRGSWFLLASLVRLQSRKNGLNGFLWRTQLTGNILQQFHAVTTHQLHVDLRSGFLVPASKTLLITDKFGRHEWGDLRFDALGDRCFFRVNELADPVFNEDPEGAGVPAVGYGGAEPGVNLGRCC